MGPWGRVLSERGYSENPPGPVQDPDNPQLDNGGQAEGTKSSWSSGLDSRQRALGTHLV